MTDRPDPNMFSTVEFPGEYIITLRVEGEMQKRITASSEAEAEAMAEKWADRVAEGVEEAELDEVSDVEVRSVGPRPKMYRVTTDGKPFQVSHLSPGDLPRDADERGF